MGRNQKRNKKKKIQTGSRNSVVGLRSEQCVGGMNSGKQESQPNKFCFANLKIFYCGPFSYVFYSSFLLVFDL